MNNITRDYYFDNIKIVLIYCVVLCHGIETVRGTSDFIVFFHETILCFVMPLFVFVTGYFAKGMAGNVIKRRKIVNILLLYIICQFIKCIIVGGENLLQPYYANWYLLAIIVWYYILPTVNCIKPRYVIVISLCCSLLIGLEEGTNFLQLSRIVVFFPYFILGFFCNRKQIEVLKKGKVKLIGIVILPIAISINYFFICDLIPIGILHGNKSYSLMELSIVEGILFRIIWYIVCMVFCFCICCFVPKRKLFFSQLGTKTLSIYIFHTIIYSYIAVHTNIFELIGKMHGTLIIYILLSMFVTFVCANPVFVKAVDKCMHISFNRMFINSKECDRL